MATNILYNNFTSGIVSPNLWGQYNSNVYHNGCAELENFRILPQGGVSRRYPTHFVRLADGVRLIPFIIDENTSYLIELGGTKVVSESTLPTIRVYLPNGTLVNEYVSSEGSLYYTSEEAQSVQFAQGLENEEISTESNTKMFLVMVHRNHYPIKFEYDILSGILSSPNQITHNDISVSTNLEEYESTKSFLTPNDNPSVVFYYGSRLWFASSKNHPYRMWASRPFKPFNFEMVDYEEVVNDITTSEDISKAIKYGEITVESSLTVSIDEDTWREKVKESGEYVFTYTTVWKLNEVVVDISEYGLTTSTPTSGSTITVKYNNISAIATSIEEVIREDNALMLETGSSKNDRIMWMSSIGNNIIVGTTSAEWIMSGQINGLNQFAYQASAYGSSPVQPVMAGNDLIFTQCGRNNLRAYIGSESGYSCPDLNFISDDLLNNAVSHLIYKRASNPALYCVLNNGKVATLFYDRAYSLQGWAMWTFSGEVKDIAIIDTIHGPETYLLIKRGDDTCLEYFDEKSNTFIDNLSVSEESYLNVPFDSKLITITYEGTSNEGSTLGKKKRIYKAVLRVLNSTGINVGYYWGSGTAEEYNRTFTPRTDLPYKIDDVEISLAGGYQKYIGFKLNSVSDKPLTVDALSLYTEVE